MTWVLATSFGAFGSMIGDTRVSFRGGVHPLGLRKVYPFSDRTVVGFSGGILRCVAAVESVNRYMQANGFDDPPLVDQLSGWIDRLKADNDELMKPDDPPSSLLMLRSVMNPQVNILLVGGVRGTLPHSGDADVRVQPFLGVDHIGSGSAVEDYQKAAEETNLSLSGFAGFAQAGKAGVDAIGRIYGQSLSRVIERTPAMSVSPDVDVLVLSAFGCSGGSVRRTDSRHVCQSLEEFLSHAESGDADAAIA